MKIRKLVGITLLNFLSENDKQLEKTKWFRQQ